ncbi:MAG: hypothetical protein ACTSU3_00030, partial [Candidatus Thorarchaeota archaeon]
MKRVYFAWIIILGISCISVHAGSTIALENRVVVVLSQNQSDGPTIDWPYSNYSVVIAWDGAYNSQTEEVWGSSYWVNDSDGVDCVLYRYRWTSQTEWINRTTTLMEGNDTTGRYYGNFTYDVWWNWDSGSVETEGDGGNFQFKIFANDTLGNWNETIPVQYNGGYILVYHPADYVLFTSLVNIAIIGIVIVSIV